jgi:hypothetical protein
VVGQTACAAAEQRLLEHSLARPDWPEFARLSCFACHHDLDGKSWRRPAAGGLPGDPVLDAWNSFVSVERVAAERANQSPTRSSWSIGDRQGAVRQPQPRRAFAIVDRKPKFSHGIDAAHGGLKVSLKGSSVPSDPMQVLDATLLDLMADEMLLQLQWDDATQIYLALSVWQDSVCNAPAGFSSKLDQLADALQFQRADGTEFSSPKTYAPGKVAPLFRSLRKLIESWNEKERPRASE